MPHARFLTTVTSVVFTGGVLALAATSTAPNNRAVAPTASAAVPLGAVPRFNG
jgi:hypothetical protein